MGSEMCIRDRYPDIGATYFLSRLPRHVGMYLALTGASITGADMALLGVAQYYAPCADRDDITRILPDIDSLRMNGTPSMAGYLDDVERCFGQSCLPDIIAALQDGAGRNDFIADALARVMRASPLSLCVTHAHMMRSKAAGFDQITHWDCAMTSKFMQNGDFFEGVRAQLIDKDKMPKWMHPGIADVPQSLVDDILS